LKLKSGKIDGTLSDVVGSARYHSPKYNKTAMSPVQLPVNQGTGNGAVNGERRGPRPTVADKTLKLKLHD
jgi:hypothetical protein